MLKSSSKIQLFHLKGDMAKLIVTVDHEPGSLSNHLTIIFLLYYHHHHVNKVCLTSGYLLHEIKHNFAPKGKISNANKRTQDTRWKLNIAIIMYKSNLHPSSQIIEM